MLCLQQRIWSKRRWRLCMNDRKPYENHYPILLPKMRMLNGGNQKPILQCMEWMFLERSLTSSISQNSCNYVTYFVLLGKAIQTNQRLSWLVKIAERRIICLLVICTCHSSNKKLSHRRGTAWCVVSVETLPIAMQHCRNYLYEKSWTNRSYEVRGLQWDSV